MKRVSKILMLLLLLSLFPINLLGQTKNETKVWIESTINNHSYRSLYPRHLEFHGNYLVYITKIGDTNFYGKIEIAKINQFEIQSFKGNNTQDGYKIYLFCKNNIKCIEEGKIINNKFIPSKDPNINYLLPIYLELTFSENNLPKRMEKAIKHLVKIYGGNASIYKEVF
ncbi:hypothetical protein NLM59_07410 [Weeksellaceae bacterium KMM 9724]|uniref:hypothetical protein n=1 Tax=Profundicola chukchiensis TaxID=2961959 RepID=UPI00243A4ED7|nr:hypothetical protein [Profundicola chukchiensis]MDG4950748.1 hypothetical protein [Profundicola chukchiensis]